MAIFVHLASVWVPFTSEAKEAVAHYPELLREITLALQECGRKLGAEPARAGALESEGKRKSLFERYIPEVGQSLGKIPGSHREDREDLLSSAPELREARRNYAARRRGRRGGGLGR